MPAKFYSLANQFGVGCEIVTLDEEDWESRLKLAILSAWNSAEAVRPRLLEAAASQLAAGEAAYERLHRSLPCLHSGDIHEVPTLASIS